MDANDLDMLGMNLAEVGTEPTNIVKNCNDKSSGSDDYSYKSAEVDTDCISRQAAIDALDALCDSECEYSKKQRSVMCKACHLGSALDVVEQLPSVQPTIFGYNVEYLELIARVLQKENLPPERITEVITDIGRIVAMVRDEFEEALRKAAEQYKI